MPHALLYFILGDLLPFRPQDYAQELSDGHNPLDSRTVPKEGVSILKGTSREKITFVGVFHW